MESRLAFAAAEHIVVSPTSQKAATRQSIETVTTIGVSTADDLVVTFVAECKIVASRLNRIIAGTRIDQSHMIASALQDTDNRIASSTANDLLDHGVFDNLVVTQAEI